mmetsp:Transcript_22420/g.45347  ORF Transcript_22420/g.45347 Transcript_22420/m.45347 type:complete len:247 (-) Transcript_22420:1288-2028(-)
MAFGSSGPFRPVGTLGAFAQHRLDEAFGLEHLLHQARGQRRHLYYLLCRQRTWHHRYRFFHPGFLLLAWGWGCFTTNAIRCGAAPQFHLHERFGSLHALGRQTVCARAEVVRGGTIPCPPHWTATPRQRTHPPHLPFVPLLHRLCLGNALRGQLCQIDDGLSRDLPLSPATPRHHLSQGHSRLGQGYQTLFRPCNHMERVTVSRLLRSAAKYDATPCSERHPPCPITNRMRTPLWKPHVAPPRRRE